MSMIVLVLFPFFLLSNPAFSIWSAFRRLLPGCRSVVHRYSLLLEIARQYRIDGDMMKFLADHFFKVRPYRFCQALFIEGAALPAGTTGNVNILAKGVKDIYHRNFPGFPV